MKLVNSRHSLRIYAHWFSWAIERCSTCNQSIRKLSPRKSSDPFESFFIKLVLGYRSSLGLEITPKVRFVKKGQKEEQPTDADAPTTEEKTENFNITKDGDEEESDDDWFTVKKKPDALDELNADVPPILEKKREVSKTKLAKKLRKKNLLINKRVKYDDDGNVSPLNCFKRIEMTCLNTADRRLGCGRWISNVQHRRSQGSSAEDG